MKNLLLSTLAFLCCVPSFAQLGSDFKLPETWGKEFTVSLSYSGSMSGGHTKLRFSYDSVIYETSNGHEATRKTYYVLKEQDRIAILAKLREFRVDDIHSEQSVNLVLDGWSEYLCVDTTCIEGGSSSEMSDKDRELYSNAYHYLEEFAINKAKKKLKKSS